MHFKWNYESPTPERQQAAKELADKIGMSPIMGYLLLQRGIRTESAAKRFFRPMLNELIDPFLMNDMDVAVDRLNDAMGRKERIMVYGDYDVDGCTAVALVYKFLQQFYSNIEYYIPDRYEEGYGISKKGLDYAAEHDVKLIIVLDCGRYRSRDGRKSHPGLPWTETAEPEPLCRSEVNHRDLRTDRTRTDHE